MRKLPPYLCVDCGHDILIWHTIPMAASKPWQDSRSVQQEALEYERDRGCQFVVRRRWLGLIKDRCPCRKDWNDARGLKHE